MGIYLPCLHAELPIRLRLCSVHRVLVGLLLVGVGVPARLDPPRLELAAALVEAEARPVGGDELLVLNAPVAVGVGPRDETVHLLLGHPVEPLLRQVASQRLQADRARAVGVEQPEGLHEEHLA
eukprot:scaffold22529_cov61-Phaeocystis_antarctica.AAC.5